MKLATTPIQPHTQDEGFATIPEAARFLSISRSLVYKLMKEGQLRYAKMGKARRIPWAELRSFATRSIVTDMAERFSSN